MILSICTTFSIIHYAEVNGNETTEWESYKYNTEFSLRCSKGPVKMSYGNLEASIFDQLYLKWDGKSLQRISYSTPVNNPHDWGAGDSGYVFKTKESGGHSVIKVESLVRKLNGNRLRLIKIELDASAESEESELVLLNVNFFTNGSWKISIENSTINSISESVVTLLDGKVSGAQSSSWSKCRLMDINGNDSFL